VKRDVVDAIESLLAHRTEDLGCYEFVLEAWMEEAATEIKRLRSELRWIPLGERLPEIDENVLACHSGEVGISHRYVDGWYWDVDEWHKPFTPTHWMPLPEPPDPIG
jgi:hypothetical protein